MKEIYVLTRGSVVKAYLEKETEKTYNVTKNYDQLLGHCYYLPKQLRKSDYHYKVYDTYANALSQLLKQAIGTVNSLEDRIIEAEAEVLLIMQAIAEASK